MEIAKKNLSRHVEYKLLIEVDPTATSRRALIITAIHETPLPMEDHRGRHGTYIDALRPLILKNQRFDGKMYALCNDLGLFSKYFQEVQKSPAIKDTLLRNGEHEYNLWKVGEHMQLGEVEYRMMISRQNREVLKRAMDSLQKEGIIQWQRYFKIQPDLFYPIGNSNYRKKSVKELMEEREKYLREIRKEAARPNSILDAELAASLINGIDILNPYIQQVYNYYMGTAYDTERCTLSQEEAIRNYQGYVRQLAYREHFHLSELPDRDLEIISNEGKFFVNSALARAYRKLDDDLRPKLFGEIKFWKEVSYEVIDPEKAKAYRPEDFSQDAACADEVSQKILGYMEGQMKQRQVEAGKNDLKDIIGYFGTPKVGNPYPLGSFGSAANLHERLKGLYGMGEETQIV